MRILENLLLSFGSLQAVGDIASILGVVIALVGFFLTIRNVKRSRDAASAAKDAANETRKAIQSFEVVADLSRALNILEEVRRLHRAGSWEILPDRYSFLKQTLISIRHSNRDLPDESMKVVQGAIVTVTDIAKEVERAIAAKEEPKNVARMNIIVSTQLDGLYEVFVKLKSDAGAGDHG